MPVFTLTSYGDTFPDNTLPCLTSLYEVLTASVSARKRGCLHPTPATKPRKSNRQATEQGDAFAQNNLGNMYVTGRGVRKDEAEAAKWYVKAAEQGQANAQCVLGKAYLYGRAGIAEKDKTKAKFWLEKSAAQGNKEAAKLLKSLK